MKPPLPLVFEEADSARLDRAALERVVADLVSALRRVLDANRDHDPLGIGQGAVEAAMAFAALDRTELVERIGAADLGAALLRGLGWKGGVVH